MCLFGPKKDCGVVYMCLFGPKKDCSKSVGPKKDCGLSKISSKSVGPKKGLWFICVCLAHNPSWAKQRPGFQD
jgi:hypothetical protein